MKISASIYSDSKRTLRETIEDLKSHHVDMFHVDCNDDPKVFDDIREIRISSNIPIDLHLITSEPEKYYDLLREAKVEYLTLQYEDLPSNFRLPDDIPGKKGLAITTNTSIEVFSSYQSFDFILIMATVPGKSGGVFDQMNFAKIRSFQNHFPTKQVHVDGGVNGEVSFILRNMGVSASVSGSYLFNAPSIGHALMDLTKRDHESNYVVSDFMIPLNESPVVREKDLTVTRILNTIENGKLGFCLVCNEENMLSGLVSNADVRKGFIKNQSDFSKIQVSDLVNTRPLTILTTDSVRDIFKLIRKQTFPISYLPVVDENKKAAGIITFVNLIKGEL